MSIPYLDKSSSHPSLPMNQRAQAPIHSDKVEAALRAILKEPYGCVFCDSGKLRNPAKPHDPECGFAMAADAFSSQKRGE